MKYNEFNVATKAKRRKGRGIAAGRGKTAGRGTKGQNARTGGGTRLGFEGGQTPLFQRIPKQKGFKSFKKKKQVVYSSALNELSASKKIDLQLLLAEGLIKNDKSGVKIIKNGEPVSKKFNIEVQAISESVRAEVTKAGGSVKIVPLAEKTVKKSAKVIDTKTDKK